MDGKNTRKSFRKVGVLAGALVAGAALSAAPAKAALVLTLNDVTDSATATPGTFTTSSPASGTLATGVTYGGVVATSNKPGNALDAEVTLNSAEIINTTSVVKTIAITVADTDFSLPGTATSTLSLIGSYSGTAHAFSSGTVSMASYADAANNANASVSPTGSTSSLPAAFGLAGSPFPSSFSGSTPITMFSRSGTSPGLYSLAGVITLTVNPGSTVDLSNDTVTFAPSSFVPEPTSLGLLLTGGMLLAGRRRKA